MKTFEVNGYYGTCNAATIYCYQPRRGGTWYAAEGSKNINYTYDEIEEGVNIESLADTDTMSWHEPIESIDDLIEAIES